MIKVGNKQIGKGQPCFIAAEIGINHNGDMSLAKQMIDAAADAGVDAVKFQNYKTEDFLSDGGLTYEYVSQGRKVIESQFEMFKRYELTREQLFSLKDHCDKKGVIFFSTPTGKDGVDDLVAIKSSLLKNGSDYLVNLPLITQMAKTGIPTILSTGMAYLSEIDEAVRTFYEAGGNNLILLHCTSSYPTPAEDINLHRINSLSSVFKCEIGFSDHSWGSTAAVGAVLMGAVFIEKHFTLDKNLPGPDHRFSSDPEEMKDLVERVRFIEKAIGNTFVGPTESEKYGRENFRLSCVAATDIKSGEIITENHITFRRPANGLPPSLYHVLVGRRLNKDISQGEKITFNNLL